MTAGQIQNKLAKDETKYDAREIGQWLSESVEEQLYKAAHTYESMIDEPEYCVVMIIADDPLLKSVIRRKFYCWPYLPSPRPNQAVFLYNKAKSRIVKRLWIFPDPQTMAEVSSLAVVHKRYKTMQAWSVAFFQGKFWEYIRYEHNIDLLSETEYMSKHREELIKAGCKIPDSHDPEPFDFSKIGIKKVIDSEIPVIN